MKKIIIGVLLLAITGALCFARGESQPSSGGSTGGQVTLTLYRQADLANPQYKYWQVMMDSFAAKYPNIKIDAEYVSDEAFHTKFQAMAASGDIPDLFTCYPGARSSYIINRGMVKDIRPLLTDALKAQYSPSLWAPQGPNGEVFFISPSMSVCTVIYVNPKLQKQLGLSNPATLDEMIAQVPAIRAAGLTPLMFANKGQWQAQSFLLSMLVDRMGGTAWFDKAMNGSAKFTDKPFVDAIAVVKKMVDTQLLAAGTNQLETAEAWGAFIRDQAVYLLDAGWRVPALKGAANPEDYAQYQVIAFPAVAGEVTKGSSAAVLSEGIAMNAKNSGVKADAAWQFMTYINGAEGSDILMQHAIVPNFKLDLSKYDVDPLQKMYIDLINSQSMGYVIDDKMDGEGVNNLLNPGLQAVMLGTKTPEQLAAEYEAWVAANDSHRKK
jgi:raffinose/stachyose/melibiose transport system substrate-binding protein